MNHRPFQSEEERLASLTAADYPKPETYTIRPAHLPQPVTIETLYLPGSMTWRWTVSYDGAQIANGLESSDGGARREAELRAKAHGVQLVPDLHVFGPFTDLEYALRSVASRQDWLGGTEDRHLGPNRPPHLAEIAADFAVCRAQGVEEGWQLHKVNRDYLSLKWSEALQRVADLEREVARLKG